MKFFQMDENGNKHQLYRNRSVAGETVILLKELNGKVTFSHRDNIYPRVEVSPKVSCAQKEKTLKVQHATWCAVFNVDVAGWSFMSM